MIIKWLSRHNTIFWSDKKMKIHMFWEDYFFSHLKNMVSPLNHFCYIYHEITMTLALTILARGEYGIFRPTTTFSGKIPPPANKLVALGRVFCGGGRVLIWSFIYIYFVRASVCWKSGNRPGRVWWGRVSWLFRDICSENG